MPATSGGAWLNHTNGRPRTRPEALGRSRGGWSTKIHAAVDGKLRPLSLHLTAGQAADSPQLPGVVDSIRVSRPGPGRPRTRPAIVIADKGYSSRANRAYLRRRGITTVIPERGDQKANRQRRGSAGGRPYAFDADRYRDRNVVERAFNRVKHWRGIATRYDKTARNYLGALHLVSILMWANDIADPGDTT